MTSKEFQAAVGQFALFMENCLDIFKQQIKLGTNDLPVASTSFKHINLAIEV